jgi:hypothetical protein
MGSPLRTIRTRACEPASTERRITPHGLRHTCTDLLGRHAAGEVVRAIVGHATEQMTHHYSHVDEAEKKAALRRVFTVVRGQKGVEKGVASAESDSTTETVETKNPARSRGLS